MVTTGPANPRFARTNPAARYVNRPPKALRAAARRGEVAAYRFGTKWLWFDLEELVQWARSHRVAPTSCEERVEQMLAADRRQPSP